MTRPKMMMARRRRRTRALKHVKRADGGGLGGAPVALDIFDAPLGIAIANNETVRARRSFRERHPQNLLARLAERVRSR